MDNIVPQISEEIRKRRRERKISQVELGRLVGMPQSQIARIETGAANIRLSTLAEVARALDLEPMLVPKRLQPAIAHMVSGHPDKANSSGPRMAAGEPEDSEKA